MTPTLEARGLAGPAAPFAAVEEAVTGRENLATVGRRFGLLRADARAAVFSPRAQERSGFRRHG